MIVTWPRTRAFSVVSTALLNGGNCQAYSTINTPTRAIAAKPRDERMRTPRERGSVTVAPGGVAPSGVAAMALVVVVVVVGSVMKKRRWVEREWPLWWCLTATDCG